MAYQAPYIDEKGMHIPTYNEIVESLCEDARRIFGQGLYLGPDSMDYQMIAAFAEKINDANEASLAAYIARSPSTAIGTGLDAVVGINGIKRKVATCSMCVVTITGDPETVINNGAVSDANGYVWDLPETVTIPESGSIDVTATCREFGVIYAAVNSLTTIKTPTRGWVSVSNSMEATVGSVAETDSELRARRALSVALPSQSILDGLRGAIESINDVKRSSVLENDSSEADENGLPPKSICAVVEGGDDTEIAETIYRKKSPGCYTYGTTEMKITDADGNDNTIRFMRPTYCDITVQVTIKKGVGYAASIPDMIRSSIVDFFDQLTIGDELNLTMLWWAALRNVESVSSPGFSIVSILACESGGTPSADNLSFEFNEAPRTNMNSITVTVQ